ncbi:MAG: EF-P lysine aminoacylase EpmA [Gammaproteobacteria bacterium]|nr:EF-P lysine aminoacylase EpmA [Gammaproteobacteria bacterium]
MAKAAQCLRLRAQVAAQIRAFFSARNVLEVATPCLVGAPVSEVGIGSVAAGGGWLRTSPEFEMKRLLAAGSGDIWQLGPVFRSDESGRLHRPEFTLLEWYRVGMDYRRLLDETLELLSQILRPLNPAAPVRLSYRDAFAGAFGTETPDDDKHLQTLAAQQGLRGCRDAFDALDFLLAQMAGHHFSRDVLTAVYDFPARQASYARISEQGHAQRFEVFYGGMELANGFQELTAAADYRARFAADNTRRARLGLAETAPDERFLAALERPGKPGLPDCSGVAAGFERLLMCLAQARDIAEVLPLTDA